LSFGFAVGRLAARISANRRYVDELSHTRFRWNDGDEEEFFEFRVRQDELTGELSLTITDFCDASEQEENQMLWDASVNQLRNRLGA
jgi:hypothetical protein